MDTWDLLVYIKDKKRNIEVPEDCLVSELVEAVADVAELNPEVVGLTYANLTEQLSLEKDEIKNKKLSEFGIRDHSVLIMVLRMFGGVWRIRAIGVRKRTLEDLPGFIKVTTDPEDEDMIFQDKCGPENRGARMPCGHVIVPSSMTSYCQSLLSSGKFIFICPYLDEHGQACNREWPFALVRHVACLSDEELEQVEKKIAETVLMKAKGIQQCPGCKNWCYRDDPEDDRVACPVCSKTHAEGLFQFCWQCLREWKGGRDKCGNVDCREMDKRLQTLATCKEKFIQGTNMCPAIRGCPRCGQLIEHVDECKHMTCNCGFSFCFFCLREKQGDTWPCVGYAKDCEVAPRQTKLPKLQEVKFSVFYNPSDYRKNS